MLRYIAIIGLIINFMLNLSQASCIKTQRLSHSDQLKPTTKQVNSDRIKRSTTPGSFNQTSDNRQLVNLELQNQQHQLDNQQEEQITFNNYDNLRLEYYKYKILSQLSMTTEPSGINDKILRDKFISNIGKMINKERKGNGVANLRGKRSLACGQVKTNKDACCLETFYVNFTEIGWDKWIIYPPGYNANYCSGQCDLSHSRYYHSTLLSKFSDVIGLCCSPKQMAPIRLLYIDEENKVQHKTMPDMVVESCDCA